ncbi:MFS transporter [Cryobacterium sp. TMT1-21]|uniref:MFS transporter n=1 Tax=Cryobacterium shii TaxID=1259235 RepID=A0AAQ2C5T9_9MICO|nr:MULTISPECIES: MFS transporter [Cryobacterium]TFC46170.1 MFS transporter [Cryobacterium shii]TFC81630.1 MFS transporter [Cryobacterium sp. TmT2-59]TFD12507.1 MFS transporter [Cryobacterium sp. TMT4-10]TFD13302.1 MFS transporter [Cryobacterium sp. TMT1-21]TFD16711.1 MFS transporter [Cryobacterium sp. TMT2-23]
MSVLVPDVTAAPPRTRAPQPVGVLIGTLVLAILTFQLNATLLSAALPAVGEQLGESTQAVSRVQSTFFLAGAVFGVVFSRWSDFLGRKRSLVIVLALLLIGTVICALAPSLPVLLIGRVLQGASNATFTISFLLLSERLSSRLFGISVGIITSVNGGLFGLDGFLGGVVTDTIGWRFLFVITLGLGLAAITCVLLFVPLDAPRNRDGSMDWWGAGILSLFLVLLTSLISQASSSGWSDALTLGYLVGTIAAGALFVTVENRTRRPLIPIRALRSRQVWPLLLTTVLTLAGVFSALNFTVVMLSQDERVGYGLSASMSALLYLTPTAFVGVTAAIFSGYLAVRIGWITSLRLSSGLITVTAVALALFSADRWLVFGLLIVMGVFYLGLFQSSVNGVSVLNSPPEARGALPGLNGACFGIGIGTGIALVAPVVATASVAGYQSALWISAGLTAASFLASLILRPAA